MRKDKIINCVQCGQNFIWTEEEQDFYVLKGLKPPTRCPVCRATFKAAKKDKFRGRLGLDSSEGGIHTKSSEKH